MDQETCRKLMMTENAIISKHVYDAVVTRDGKWWMIEVPELEVITQALSENEVKYMATDLIAVWLDVEPHTFSVNLIDQTAPNADVSITA
jgi:predicted RNase H-like HicB family nuclease